MNLARPTLSQLRALGRLLQERRAAAGLSRPALAKAAKLSDATLKFLETARRPPSRATLLRLIGVPALKLSWDEIQAVLGSQPPPTVLAASGAPDKGCCSSRPYNCYLPTRNDSVNRARELARLLRGAGGHIPHSALYLDCSALEYLDCLARWPEALELRESLPLPALARLIAACAQPSGLHVLALGSGEGVSELRLLSLLASDRPAMPLELTLVDFSAPLLHAALHRAARVLAGIRVGAALTDFSCLSMDTPLFERAPPRQRLFVLLGGSLADVEHEPSFLEYGLVFALPGDLLALDVRTCAASSDKPSEIRSREPWLNQGLPAFVSDWITGPLRRACPDITEVELHVDLEQPGPLVGSYTLNVRALVRSRLRPERRFSLYRQTRYDPEYLSARLRGWGWEPVEILPYGFKHRGALLLFRRTAPAAPR